MNRNSFYGGPAYLTHDSVTWQARAGFEIATEIKSVEERTALQGKIGEREDYSISMLRFQPHALKATLATQIGKLFAFTASNIGSLLFPNTDLPLVIQGKDGLTRTFSAAKITQPPSLVFAANRPLFGDTEFTCIRKNNTAATSTSAHVAVASNAYSEPALDPTDILNTTYTLAWGGSPFADIICDEEGVKVDIRYTWQELGTWVDGLIQYRLTGVEVEARFVPINMDSADFYDSHLITDGSSAGRGKFLGARGQTLTITGATTGDPILTINNATPVSAPERFNDESRIGEVVLRAQRKYSAGWLAQYAFTYVA